MGELLNAALVQLQGNLPRVTKTESANITRKDGTPGPKYKYADLADVAAAIMPVLSACGLAFTAMPDVQDGRFGLRYQLRHVSGEADGGFYPLPDPGSTAPMQVGSAITYARRYSLCAVTGVAPDGDDDDGASAPRGHESFDDARPADANRGSSWRPAANPSGHKAQRSTGPLPDDQWTGPPADTPMEMAPGTCNLDQQRQIAIRLGERGLTSRADKISFCNEVIQQRNPSRSVASSKELSFTEAVEVLRVCAS